MTEPKKDDPKPVDNAETTKEISNSINVSTALSAGSWNVRIRKVLMHHDSATLGALGQAMLTLVETVENLKRDKVAVVKSIETTQVPVQSSNRTVSKAKLTITLARGENAVNLSGYRLRRTLKLFDHLYAENAGEGKAADPFDYETPERIPLDVVQNLKFDVDPDALAKANASAYLTSLAKSKKDVSAEEFVKYVSQLISPTLANETFDDAFAKLLPKEEESPAPQANGQ